MFKRIDAILGHDRHGLRLNFGLAMHQQRSFRLDGSTGGATDGSDGGRRTSTQGGSGTGAGTVHVVTRPRYNSLAPSQNDQVAANLLMYVVSLPAVPLSFQHYRLSTAQRERPDVGGHSLAFEVGCVCSLHWREGAITCHVKVRMKVIGYEQYPFAYVEAC